MLHCNTASFSRSHAASWEASLYPLDVMGLFSEAGDYGRSFVSQSSRLEPALRVVRHGMTDAEIDSALRRQEAEWRAQGYPQ